MLKTTNFTEVYKVTKATIQSVDRTKPDSGYAFSKNTKYYYSGQTQFVSNGSLPIIPGATDSYKTDSIFLTHGYYANYLTTNYYEARDNLEGFKALHYYNKYKYCNGNQLTAICPEFEINQVDYNQFFTG